VDEVFTVLRVVVSLAVVVGVIWFVQRRFVRTSRSKSRKRAISVVARQSVGRNSSIAVVEFRGKEFLLGVTEHGISVLDAVGEAEAPAAVPAEPEAGEPVVAAVRPVTRRASSKQFAAVLSGVQQPTPEPSIQRVARTRTPVSDALAASLKRPARIPGEAPLTGSILSGTTWKQAFTAIKGPR
jgi:flagellar protein FliO/FliZ